MSITNERKLIFVPASDQTRTQRRKAVASFDIVADWPSITVICQRREFEKVTKFMDIRGYVLCSSHCKIQ